MVFFNTKILDIGYCIIPNQMPKSFLLNLSFKHGSDKKVFLSRSWKQEFKRDVSGKVIGLRFTFAMEIGNYIPDSSIEMEMTPNGMCASNRNR